MFFRRFATATLFTAISLNAIAGFGPQKTVENAEVSRIYQGTGATFVTFSGASLPECASHGGYLQPSWSEANGGSINDAATGRMLSTILAAKAMSAEMQVRYKVNDAGTGWNKCAITGIYLE